MQKFILIAIVFYSMQLAAQSTMFRGNAQHNATVSTSFNLVYDTKDLAFSANAPIRSTPLISNNTVFFGTTKGDFFAVDKRTAKEKWKYSTGEAINSSASIQNGKIFFSDNKQTVYALHETTGKLIWKFNMGTKLSYPWRFDYYYSAPTLYNDKLLIGGDDGFMYMLNQTDGKLIWKYNAGAIIRASAAVNNNEVLFGDVNAIFHSVDVQTGKQKWIYKTSGDSMKLEQWGFDRKALLSSPVISNNKILFGSREGFLYCLDATGKLLWKNDHEVSWVISTVAVKDSFVVTGTSDGRFVQAVHINNGKEIWKFSPNSLFWSSPTIVDDIVYAGSFDGVLYCLDLKTGKRISQFTTGGMIMSSPVWNDNRLYVGSDDGFLYILKGRSGFSPTNAKRYVFFDKEVTNYYRNGADMRVKSFLNNCGYKTINSSNIDSVLTAEKNTKAIIVLASHYLPASVIVNGKQSLLRQFLDGGGTLVFTGINPLIYEWNEKMKMPVGFNIPAADTVLDLPYGPNDTRGMGGQFTCFPTAKGEELGLPDHWVGSFGIKPTAIDVVLGKTENGETSAFIKNYNNGGRLVQLWIHPELPVHLDAIIKAAECVSK
jgi:eukaryotic-like serine/threonine-protein kinase